MGSLEGRGFEREENDLKRGMDCMVKDVSVRGILEEYDRNRNRVRV